jgi:hypothetical protein
MLLPRNVGMAEYKREIGVAVTIAVIAALGIGALAISIFPGSGAGTSTPSGTTVTLVTTQGSTTAPQPWEYSILGQEPFLTVTPANHTFTVPFDVTTHNYSISLAYSQAESYAWLFSNGTQWVSSARACPPETTTTLTGTGQTYTVTATSVSTVTGSPPILTHASQVPCGEYPGEWWALNGTLVSRNVAITQNDVQMSIQPSAIPAHFTGKMNVTLTITMPPGNYGVFLAVLVSEPDNPGYGTSLLYIIYYMPMVVQPS